MGDVCSERLAGGTSLGRERALGGTNDVAGAHEHRCQARPVLDLVALLFECRDDQRAFLRQSRSARRPMPATGQLSVSFRLPATSAWPETSRRAASMPAVA